MPSRKIDDLHPKLQPICRQFIERCTAAGLDILITCTFRSAAEQTGLYAIGRSVPGAVVTNAKAGQSAHNFTIDGKPAALAFDIVPLLHGKPMWQASFPDWQIAGKIGMELGLNWYGKPSAPFREYPHFELSLEPKEQ